jgi:pimeloyl-ACP methyl ester carboxylesterase
VTAEPRPVREADQTGFAERAGVRLAFKVYDNPGRPTVLLMPTWSIVPSRFWRAQVPYLARHFRVVTFDGRGCGESDRPAGAESYVDAEYAEDAIAVMDATGTERAVLVALSRGDAWSVLAAAHHPDRVTGIVAIAPASGSLIGEGVREKQAWESAEGEAKYNRRHWLEGGYDDFVEWFFARMFPEPHSTKQIEDAVRWAHEVSPATLVDTTAGRLTSESIEDSCRLVRCPVLVLHGTDDRIRPHAIGERLAELTGGSLVLLEGSGHGVHARDPVQVNQLIRQFVDRVHPVVRHVRSGRAISRPPRALYLSSPIGLGHARRDLAIASELRKLRPDLRIDWLAQHPVTEVLAPAGERIHPASAWLAMRW